MTHSDFLAKTFVAQAKGYKRFRMKKWYNVELAQENAERLGAYLKKYEYKYEASACGIWSVHFEIYLNKDAASKVDSFIRSLPEF